jgi:hypothetical protein
MADRLNDAAERAIPLVIEAECRLCKVELRIHDERACCSCCGDFCGVSSDRLEVMQAVWAGR